MPAPLPLPKFTAAEVASFWRHVDRSRGPDGCWPWVGDHVARGYGRWKVHGREFKPHRIALALTLGRDPGSAITRHTCDHPPCCNPAHLVPGTNQENTTDAKRRGRLRGGVGERHGSRTHPESRTHGERSGNAKLTTAQVEEMRWLYATGAFTHEELAARFNVKRETIGVNIRGKNWGHLPTDRSAAATVAAQHRALTGERNPSARLNAAQVRAIRLELTEGGTLTGIAARYDVTKQLVYAIRQGRVWRHVT